MSISGCFWASLHPNFIGENRKVEASAESKAANFSLRQSRESSPIPTGELHKLSEIFQKEGNFSYELEFEYWHSRDIQNVWDRPTQAVGVTDQGVPSTR